MDNHQPLLDTYILRITRSAQELFLREIKEK